MIVFREHRPVRNGLMKGFRLYEKLRFEQRLVSLIEFGQVETKILLGSDPENKVPKNV